MKKIYFLVTSLLLITGYAAQSQCTNGSAFGSAVAPTTNTTPTTITTCAFGGEYSTITGATAGSTYLFNATGGAGNFITIRQGTPGGAVLGFGVPPLSVVCTVSGNLYLHYNTNASCGTDGSCHTGTVQCTSCPAPPDPCTSIVNIPACATPVVTAHNGAGSWSVTACGFSTPGQERIYSFTPATTGVYSLNVTAVGVSGFLDYYWKLQSAGCGPTGWTCIDDNSAVGTDPIGLLTAGVPIYILVDDETTAATTHTFNISCGSVAPANDLCSGALPLPCNGSVAGTTVGSTIDAVGTCVTTLNTAGGVWYTFVGNGAPNTISTCTGTAYDSKIGVFSGSCGSLICVTGNDDACGLQSSVTFTANTGTTYYVLVTGFGSATGAFTLTRTSVLPNDLCTGAITINCGQTITGSTACGATTDAVATCVTALNTAPGVWYRFVGDASPVTLSLCGSSYDTKIGVFTGTCTALTCVTGNDDFCGVQSQVTFNTNAGVTYYILVTGFSTNTGNFTLTRTCAPACAGVPSPGSVTPVASTVCRGTNVTLTASGYTNSGLLFQWNSAPAAAGPYAPIAGAVSNVYTAAPTVTTYYTVTVTCSIGGGAATTSPPVVINVDGIQHINVSATPSTLCAGSSTAITGTAINGITLSSMVVVANSGTINLAIPDNNPTGASHTMAVPAGIISTNPADLRVRVNMVHTWVGDVAFRITSPCGTTFLFDRPGTTGAGFGNADDVNGVYTFDVAVAPIIPEASVGGLVPPGSYRPSDAAGAGNPTWSPLTFPCAATGNWTITGIDAAGGDVGTIRDWQILAPSPSNYTHTLTGGAGTITQNASTGVANATGNFTVSNIPAGNHTFTLTSTDPFGCSVASPVSITVNPIPVITFSPPSATICNGQIQQINVYAAPGGILQTFSNNTTTNVPGIGTSGIGGPYPSVIGVAGLPAAGVSVRSVEIRNFNHTFPDDVDLVLVSPSGTQQVILMSDAGGATSATGQNFTFSDAASASLADAAFNNTGAYKPTNHPANPDNFPAPGPLSLTQPLNPLLSTFTGDVNGNWRLYAIDDLAGDAGLIGGWSITFDVPAPVVLTQSPASPNTIFTNAAATIPYVAGTPVYTVWVNPTATTTYTANGSALGCNAVPASMTVTVNQLPTIVTQPSPATQTVCPGFTVTYTVVAGGTGPFTYQWRRNGVNLTNGSFISGVNTPTLTIANVQVANAGTYDVVVSGACTPPATSNGVVLNVGSAPTITTQPVNTTVCEGSNATLSVVAAGTPTPTIFQWQVSTDGGATWTNLTTGGSFTATLTLSNVTLSMNNNRYRVIITNSCAMTITSNVITLTVNPRPVVTALALPARICLSDTLVPLSGSPTGGTWTGIGVSGFNFVPTATAVGTYTLTYTFTNSSGCTNTASVVAKVEDCPERIRLLSDDGVILYPNPNNGIFSIRINSTLYNYLGMKVYDMAGRLVNGKVVKNGIDQALVSPVFSGLVYGRVVPIDLSYLPSGMYLVKFYYDDGIRSSEKGFLVSIIK
ncbi:MAG: T9SS type A sorting domain-containing protein [Chitinophagaceae bacterium]|nr:T9SS type A sorting domain-containing protein [Chitinophagaceae bacterium]